MSSKISKSITATAKAVDLAKAIAADKVANNQPTDNNIPIVKEDLKAAKEYFLQQRKKLRDRLLGTPQVQLRTELDVLQYNKAAEGVGLNPEYEKEKISLSYDTVGMKGGINDLKNSLIRLRNAYRDTLRKLVMDGYIFEEEEKQISGDPKKGTGTYEITPKMRSTLTRYDGKPEVIELGKYTEEAKGKSWFEHLWNDFRDNILNAPAIPIEMPFAAVEHVGSKIITSPVGLKVASWFAPLVVKLGPNLGKVTPGVGSAFAGYLAGGEAIHGAGNLVFNASGKEGDYMDYLYNQTLGGHYDPFSRFAFSFADPAFWPGWIHAASGLGVKAADWAIGANNTAPKLIKPVLNLRYLDNRLALSDLFLYVRRGRHLNIFTINPETNLVIWSSTIPEGNVPFITEAIRRGHPRNGRSGFFYIKTDNGQFMYNSELGSSGYTSRLPEEWGGWGEAYVQSLPNGKTNRMVLTAPRTDLGGTNMTLPNTLPKDMMKDFWINSRSSTRPGVYLSGDEVGYPLGLLAIEKYLNEGLLPALKTALSRPEYKYLIDIGLSPDSYSAIIRLAQREGSKLRWGRGFTDWNSSAVENKAISDAFKLWKKGEMTLQEYEKIFNDWAVPLGGRPLEFITLPSTGKVLPLHPHPYIYIEPTRVSKPFKGIRIGNYYYKPDMNTVYGGLPFNVKRTPIWQVEQPTGINPLIKSLMVGSSLERLVSKDGTIHINLLQAYINKPEVSKIDKYLIGKALENHAGETRIDYNALRREVLEMIPKYERVPLYEHAAYGMDGLGFPVESDPALPSYTYSPGTNTNTFTFESPGLKGNNKHYPGLPLGHARTYTTSAEPDVLYVMESQSDWALAGGNRFTLRKNTKTPNPIRARMVDTYTLRQIQENLRYAAENGLTKMRYPTPETAAKIEGYNPSRRIRLIENEGFIKGMEKYLSEKPNDKNMLEIYNYAKNNNIDYIDINTDPYISLRLQNIPEQDLILSDTYVGQYINELEKLTPVKLTHYPSEHQTILKKYAEFPKQYEKLFGKGTVREVTDTKGNTWYEVDVPENYRNGNAEILFSTASPSATKSLTNEGIRNKVIKEVERYPGEYNTIIDDVMKKHYPGFKYNSETKKYHDIRVGLEYSPEDMENMACYYILLNPSEYNNFGLSLKNAMENYLNEVAEDFGLRIILPRFRDYGIYYPWKSIFRNNREGWYDPNKKVEIVTDRKSLGFESSALGAHIPSSGRNIVILYPGIGLNRESTVIHEAASHGTDEFIPLYVMDFYNDMIKDLESKAISTIKGRASLDIELRATKNEIIAELERRRLNIDEVSDKDLLDILKDINLYGYKYYKKVLEVYPEISKDLPNIKLTYNLLGLSKSFKGTQNKFLNDLRFAIKYLPAVIPAAVGVGTAVQSKKKGGKIYYKPSRK